ncbi:MAG: hypothetical protein K9H16_08595, partial [Bacteroidales bacterium]|nr:hypothetical protein [Bacteroidales bacterium]
MNSKLKLRKYSRWVRNAFLVFSFFLYSATAVNAQKKTKKNKPEISFEIDLATYYDDNILKYSEKYIERFLNNEDQGRFHIKTYDDMIVSTGLDVNLGYKLFGKMKSEIDASVDYTRYLVNDIKSFSNFGIGFRQDISKKLSLRIFYDYTPEFYVRHFRDDDWVAVYGYTEETFTPYVFAKDNYGITAQYDLFKNTRVRLYYYFSKYYHNKDYTEYDSDNNLYRIKIEQKLHKNFSLDLTYQFVTSDAKGYDQPGESKGTSDDGDATYEEDGYIFGLVWKMPRIKNRYHSLEFETVIYNRYFKTNKSPIVDDMHS